MKKIPFVLALALASPINAGAAAPHADYIGSFELTGSDAYFGGFSGLEFSADGTSFTTLSDKAALISGQVTRNAAGAIVAVDAAAPSRRLLDANGQPLIDPENDSEGLAEAPDGTFYVSFERAHRVAHYRADGHLIDTLPIPDFFAEMESNSGMEGLAIAPDGTLYTQPEGNVAGMRSDPVFRYRGGVWDRPFRIAEDGTWRPTGSDFGPDGRLYILERDFWPFLGFRSRLRRISFDGRGVTADDVLFETHAGRHGNLEGLSIWQDGAGAIHATMISDNNFLRILRCQFVDYVVRD